MRASALLTLAARNLRADGRGALLNGAAVAVGATALCLFLALGMGVGQAVRQLFPSEARLVEVVPSSVSLGPLLGGGQLDDAAVRRLAALPGVTAAWPRMNLRVPLAATRGPEGLALNYPPGFVLQIPAVGVEPGLLAGALAPGAAFADPGPEGAIPVVLSSRLLELYNKTIAPAWNVRRLPTGAALVGLELPVKVGFSIVPLKTEDRVYDARLKLSGLSDRVPVHMLALPLDVVRRLHREYGKADQGYSAVTLQAASAEEVPSVAAAVRRSGFAVDDADRALAERAGAAVGVATLALSFLALLMLAVAGLAIAQSLLASVRARAREIALLQAVGATRGDVRALVLAEAGLLGLGGGLLGSALARLCAAGVDRAALRLLPDFPFRPGSFVHFPPWLWAVGLGVAVLAAVVGAIGPAAAATRIDPARTLA
ncbi:MAG: ABC transporter permease [Deltaproteobacteria bacterium]|nr:ABC transporter permease [Deltaproteobacteria bacterium]